MFRAEPAAATSIPHDKFAPDVSAIYSLFGIAPADPRTRRLDFRRQSAILEPMEDGPGQKDRAEADARLEAELTRYLETALAEPIPPRLIELARELQKRLREG